MENGISFRRAWVQDPGPSLVSVIVSLGGIYWYHYELKRNGF